MRIDVVPTVSVNEVEFGMDRKQVRLLLGKAKEFRKSQYAENTTDDFGFCHVFYDTDDKCEAIEIFDEAEVYVDGKLIFPTDINSAMKIINDFEHDDDGLTSYSLSIGIYAPDDEPESILIGIKGYYDE